MNDQQTKQVVFIALTEYDQIKGVGQPRDPQEYDTVYLADDEWGNLAMDKVAAEWFREFPTCQFVEVYEHAGWYLGYRNDGENGGRGSCWTTANDQARLPKPQPQPVKGFSGYYFRRNWLKKNGEQSE